MRTTVWTRGLSRPKRVLYLSSPSGSDMLDVTSPSPRSSKRLRPDVEIDWLAQHPVTTVLEAEGEHIHPASRWLANESAHIASESSEHDLHCFQALRSMDEIMVANFMLFQEVVEEGLYDLIVGDEAWDVDHFWHENPELKRGQHVWLTDFVGFLPMPDGGEHEAFLTTDYNAEMIEHIARYPWIRDRAIFVGNPDDIVADSFGAELPAIRDWTEQHFSFSGYITGFTPPTADEVPAWRAELGYRDDELVCVVAVGGSGVGRALLDKVIAAYPIAKRQLPALRMIAVAGPRIDPAMFPTRPGSRGPRLRRPPVPAPVRLRPGRGPGRPHDDHGAGRRQAAVPLLPARAPLRAELPRPPPPRSLRRRALHGLRQHRSRSVGGRHRRQHRPAGDLPRRRDGRRRARRPNSSPSWSERRLTSRSMRRTGAPGFHVSTSSRSPASFSLVTTTWWRSAWNS